MRVALARALFIQPEFLLLDEREYLIFLEYQTKPMLRIVNELVFSRFFSFILYFSLRIISYESLGYGGRVVSCFPHYSWLLP